MDKKISQNGFTLIETLVAISLLTIAIVAPMSLTTKSLASAYYARDQITAYYLAQEAIEALRSIRDAQILQIVQSGSGASFDIFGPIPKESAPFTIDARMAEPAEAIIPCSGGPCPLLQTDGTLYGYGFCSGADTSCNTYFTRTVRASFKGSGQDQMRVTVEVKWRTGGIQERTFSISEDLYRWVEDGVGQ